MTNLHPSLRVCIAHTQAINLVKRYSECIFNELRTREGNRKVQAGPSLSNGLGSSWFGCGLTEVRADLGAGLSWVQVDSKPTLGACMLIIL